MDKGIKWNGFREGGMWFRALTLLCLFLLSQASRGQQKAIDVPFDNTPVAGSPIEVNGTLSVRETVLGNQVESQWEENIVAKNISNKPILLLIGALEAEGPRSDGGLRLILDRFFSPDVIQPGDTLPLLTGSSGRGSCCINPLDEPHDPKAAFRLEFVQFVDGSSFGTPASAKDTFASRTSTLLALRNLNQTYSDQGEQKFLSQLVEAHGPTTAVIRWTAKEKGTGAAIAQLREILTMAKKHDQMIGGQQLPK